MAKDNLTIEVTQAMREAMLIRGREPVDYFALLGIKREVSDEKLIDTAILERSKQLRKWQSSPIHGDEAVKLLSIVHRAGKIIKDAARRGVYRKELERMERGEGVDAHEEFRDMVRAAMADSTLDATARKELMRYASEHSLSQAEAQQVVVQVREEIEKARASETVPPKHDDNWEFRIAEDGEEGFGLMLDGMESSGEFNEKTTATLMAQAGKYKVAPDRAAMLIAEFQKKRFKKIVKRVAAGGVISEAQVRLLLPKAAAYGLDQRQAYDMIADFTLSARSTEDALRTLAYAQTFSDDEITNIVDNQAAPKKRKRSASEMVPDWLRNLVLIGLGSAALIFLLVFLKDKFQNPAATPPPAVSVPGAETHVATNPVSNSAQPPANAAASTPEPPLEERPDPPSGMIPFRPEKAGDPPAFEMGVTEVTCAQFQQYLRDTLDSPPAGWTDDPARANQPVTKVTRTQAQTYCNWLNKKNGSSGRYQLPSQGEFLRALRGRTTRSNPMAPDFWSRSELGSGQGPLAARQSPRDKIFYGIGQVYDLMGNVAEWGREDKDGQAALLGGDFTQTAPDFNPLVIRWIPPATAQDSIGFRVVHTLK